MLENVALILLQGNNFSVCWIDNENDAL